MSDLTTIVGNLVEDPELRFTNTGIAVANLPVSHPADPTRRRVWSPAGSSGSVMPVSVNSSMSAGMPYNPSTASRQAAAPGPPVMSVPSMSNSAAIHLVVRSSCGPAVVMA